MKIRDNNSNTPNTSKVGKHHVATVFNKGIQQEMYLNDDAKAHSLALLGPQGCGKTTYLNRYCSEALNSKESIIVIDYTQESSINNDLIASLAEDKVCVLDLAEKDTLLSFAFEELAPYYQHDFRDILIALSSKIETTINLLNAIPGTPLEMTTRMKGLLAAACWIVYTDPNTSLIDVRNFLMDATYREKAIAQVPSMLSLEAQSRLSILRQAHLIDAIDQTVPTYVTDVLDRFLFLSENWRLRSIFENKSPSILNFNDILKTKDLVIIKIPSTYYSPAMQEILSVCVLDKLRLALNITKTKPYAEIRPTNLVLTELFHLKSSEQVLVDLHACARAYDLNIISILYTKQDIEMVKKFNYLIQNYIVFTGTPQSYVNNLLGSFHNVDVPELRDLKKFMGWYLLAKPQGYSSFIGQLPPPIYTY